VKAGVFFMPYHLYILHSAKRNRYYVGHTGDLLSERLRRHNSNHKGFTGTGADWRMVYAEVYDNKEIAYAREREIKGWKSKLRIEELLRSGHSVL
jgi:putative endonuclease